MRSLTEIGSITSGKEAANTRFQCCQNSREKLLYIRAIQGHSGGETVELEMMGHVYISPNWKQFVFNRGCSFDLKFLLGAGLIARGREGRENRHTVFFTPLNPWGTEVEEEYCDDLTKPRKVHYKTGWTHSQDSVYWIHLGHMRKAHEKGIAFWQMKSHAIIAYNTIPPDYRTSDLTTRRNDHFDLRHAVFLKVPGMNSSSKRQPAVASI